jgi:hypothetical protein
MMTKANILALAKTISVVGSTTNYDRAFDEMIEDLAKKNEPIFAETTTFTVSSGTSRYSIPADGTQVAAIFFENTQLWPVTLPELESYNPAWRVSSADNPEAFVMEEETARSVRLYPSPSTGATGTWLITTRPVSGIPDYLALYAVFAMLEKDFSYPSDHQDKELSKLCGQIATIFYKILGLP